MLKKMMLLAMALGALVAFAAPAAQGQELYEVVEVEEEPVNVPLEVGAGVTATSTNLVTTVTANGAKIECEKITIHGTVTANSTTEANIENNTVTVQGCNTALTELAAGPITIKPNTTGVWHLFTFKIGVLHFAGSIPFTYVHATESLTVAGTDQLSGTAGPAQVVGSFALETSDGTPVFIS